MKTLNLNGELYEYPLFLGTYAERDVEVPIIYKEIQKLGNGKILEVGNVIQTYIPITEFPHTIIDKFEIFPGVINDDIRTFDTIERFDLIFSMTTLEHVGVDEGESDGILDALSNMKRLLASGGKIIFTVPINYNIYMDHLFINDMVECDRISYIKCISEDNEWIQCSKEEAMSSKYNHPFPFTNASIIGEVYKKK